MNLKNTYNKIAKDWFRDHKEDTWWVDSVNKFLNYLKTGDKILDVGCGAAVKSKYLVDKGFGVIGVDFSKEMVKLAKEYCLKGSFYVKDIKQPLGLGVFDGIFAQAVLLHIPKGEVVKVLQNLSQSLKKDGYIYIAVKELRPGAKDEQIVIEKDYNYVYQRFFSFFTLPEIKNYLTESGFQIVHEAIVTNIDTNWVIVIAKKQKE